MKKPFPSQPIKELTKREYFALKSLEGLLHQFKQGDANPREYAEKALQFADALLNALRDGGE